LVIVSPLSSALVTRRTPSSTLFPSTTLFRSCQVHQARDHGAVELRVFLGVCSKQDIGLFGEGRAACRNGYDGTTILARQFDGIRSEEHTSELQSRENLVCRLLLEKKKIKRAV